MAIAVRVLGAYLPRIDAEGMDRFIVGDVRTFQTTMLDLVARGVSRMSPAEIAARAEAIPDELRANLESCALFEILVEGAPRSVIAEDFCNSVTGQLGWEGQLLTEDGQRRLERGNDDPSNALRHRIVFWIHDWDEGGHLLGPTGPLGITDFAPVPQRLWNLAPYVPVD